MEYTKFKEELAEAMQERMQKRYGECQVTFHKMPRVNGCLETLAVNVGEAQLGPEAPLEDIYESYTQNGCHFQECVDAVFAAYDKFFHAPEEAMGQKDNLDIALLPEVAKHKIIYLTVSYEKNKELLEMVPYRMQLDLAVIYRLVVAVENDMMQSVIITNEHLEMLGMTEEELFEAARINTPRFLPDVVCCLPETTQEVKQLVQIDLEEQMEQAIKKFGSSPFYSFITVTAFPMINCSYHLIDLSAIHRLAEKLESDLYILPSSITELMCVPVGKSLALGDLAKMLRRTNKNTRIVPRDIFLSNSVYLYRRETKELTIASSCYMIKL